MKNQLGNPEILVCFSDSDWAGDNVDRKSTSGFIINFFGNLVFWKTMKESIVTKSSTFAEYVALSEAISELLFVKELIKFFNVEIKMPIKVFEDNSGALDIAQRGNFTKNSKHIEIHYHFINDNYKKGVIDILPIDSDENTADLFTRPLGKIKFEKFRRNLNLK